MLFLERNFAKAGKMGEVDLNSGSTISTLLHDKNNPKDCQVLSLGDSGFLQYFRVVSSDYGTPRNLVGVTVKRGFWIFFSKLLSKLRWLEKTYVTTKKAPSMVLLYIQMYLLLKINFDVMFRIVADEELHQPPASNY